MPKMKTKRAAAKRFQLMGSGRLKRARANKQHLNRGTNTSQLRLLKTRATVDDADYQRIMEILPYGTGK